MRRKTRGEKNPNNACLIGNEGSYEKPQKEVKEEEAAEEEYQRTDEEKEEEDLTVKKDQ